MFKILIISSFLPMLVISQAESTTKNQHIVKGVLLYMDLISCLFIIFLKRHELTA